MTLKELPVVEVIFAGTLVNACSSLLYSPLFLCERKKEGTLRDDFRLQQQQSELVQTWVSILGLVRAAAESRWLRCW